MKIIIVGAGLGGLSAACLLAKQGYKVQLFESHLLPGGYTAGFYRKGFYFESGTDAFEMGSMVFPIMKKLGVLDEVGFTKLEPYHHVNTSFNVFPLSYRAYKTAVLSAFPQEATALKRFFRQLGSVYKVMRGFFTPTRFKLLSKIFNGPRMGILYARFGGISVSAYLQRFFSPDSKLYRILCNLVPYPNSSAINLGGALWTIYHDYWTVHGGMQSWADLLAERIRQHGGEILLSTRVDSFTFTDGLATGVIAKGVPYQADVVISSMDYKKTLRMVSQEPSPWPEPLRKRAEETKVSPGYFVVYLGLNIAPEELRTYLKSSHTIMYDAEHSIDINSADDSRFFNHSRLTVYSPSLINSSFAPPDCSTLMLTTFSPYNWLDRWDKARDREAYKRLKKEVENILISRVESIIPGLRVKIAYQDSATPHTFERFTNNSNGATNAWGLGSDNLFYKNTLKAHIHTPIKNFYIGSAWAAQVGGVPFALQAGHDCAVDIMRRYKP